MNSYWWCPHCRVEVDPRAVTYTEQHEACGRHVEAIDYDERTVIERLRAENERLTKALQFEQHWLERIGTHGPGCYQWGPSHWLCAVNEIKRLAALRGEGE